jgi:hypothetical protein
MAAAAPKLESLLAATTFREFLRLALLRRYEEQGKINFADFSRRAGFASRSYLTELLGYKKGLSRDGLMKLKSAMGLPRGYLRLFELLVYLEQPELATKSFAGRDLAEEIRQQRRRIREEAVRETKVRDSSRLVRKPAVFRVFAALGTPETGATMQEIERKTRLPGGVIDQSLALLRSEGAVEFADSRFYPRATQFDFLDLKNPQNLSELVSQVTQEIRREAPAIVERENDLVFYSALSIPTSRLAAFKAKMRETILENLDLFQNDEGEEVVQVFVSTYR